MPPRERVITFYLHQMVENVINQIDEKNHKLNQFQFEPLFINIFYCFYFKRFLSPYYRWRYHAIKVLKRNIKKNGRNAYQTLIFSLSK